MKRLKEEKPRTFSAGSENKRKIWGLGNESWKNVGGLITRSFWSRFDHIDGKIEKELLG